MNRTLKRDCQKFSKELDSAGKRILVATIPAGTIVDIEFPEFDLKDYSGNVRKDATRMILTGQGIDAETGNTTTVSVRCRASNWNKYFKANPKPPTARTLINWEMEGICKSLAGNTVEPDGWSFDGTPSWLLAFGVI